MSSEARFLFLGCSTSVGVPVIGCDCAVCTSGDPRNARTRSSAYLAGPFGNILIDSGPDLHQQALRENLRTIDAVIYTHGHVDHVAGFDELRAFCWQRDSPLPLYGSAQTHDILRQMFPWAFVPEGTASGYVKADLREFAEPFEINGLKIIPIEVIHGKVLTHGFRFEWQGRAIAYFPDVKAIPEEGMKLLTNLDILIIDALRPEPHQTHLSIAEAQEIVEILKPKQTYFTHMSHELDWATTDQALPAHIHLAYDGLELSF